MDLAVPIGAPLALFVLFLVMQARALFGGDDYVQRTANLTYSQYAVRVLATAGRHAAGHRRRHRGVVVHRPQRCPAATDNTRPASAACARATLLVVVSAFLRMERCINAYGATRDRVFGLYFEVFLAAVIIALMAVGINFDARPLVRRVILLTVFSTLGFALLNPDQLIAKTNIDRASSTQKVDAWYFGLTVRRRLRTDPTPSPTGPRLRYVAARDTPAHRSVVARLQRRAKPVAGATRRRGEPAGCGTFPRLIPA